MSVPLARITTATTGGIAHARQAADAAAVVDLPYTAGLALLCTESADPAKGIRGGANIYHHDRGGALSTIDGPVTVCGKTYPRGSNIEVTEANAGVYLILIASGEKGPNGIGPTGATYAATMADGRHGGIIRLMLEEELLPWNPLHNMIYGFRTIARHRAAGNTWEQCYTLYRRGNLKSGIDDRAHVFTDELRHWRLTFRKAGI